MPLFDATSYFQGRKVSQGGEFSLDKLDSCDRWKGEIPKDAYVAVLHSNIIFMEIFLHVEVGDRFWAAEHQELCFVFIRAGLCD